MCAHSNPDSRKLSVSFSLIFTAFKFAFPTCFCPEAGKAVKLQAPLGINSYPVLKNGPLSTLLDHIWPSADLEMFCFIRTLTLHPKPSTPSYC